VITHKRGDTLDLIANIPSKFADGYFIGFATRCQIRTETGALISDSQCGWVDPETTRAVRITVADTEQWPTGNAVYDVQFVRSGDSFTISSTTQAISIVKDITR
jgi:hypothetical protein